MLVTSSVCHSTSYRATSFPCPLMVAISICRQAARHSGESLSTVAAVVMICPALAWLVMRLAVCTVAPNTSRFSSITGPKWQPMRIATGWPSTLSWAWLEICCCIWAAAFRALSALGKVDMTSSPMVLITVPWRCSVALRMTSMQIATISRARRSPISS